MPIFLSELDDHAQTLDRELLALERDPFGPEREEQLAVLYRAAHSLKGDAWAVGIEQIGHEIVEARRQAFASIPTPPGHA